MEIHVNIEGLKETVESFKKLGAKLKNAGPFLKASGLVVLESVNRNFMAGGRPGWLPLKPATLIRRAYGHSGQMTHTRGKNKGRMTKQSVKYMLGAKPLRDTGLLMNSIGKGMFGVYVLAPLHLIVGTNVPYAPYQQATRPFMMLQPRDEEVITNIAVSEIEKSIKESGL